MEAITLTVSQWAHAKRAIRRHYGLARPVTAAEVEAEIANLRRRGVDNLDDSLLALACALEIGTNAVRVYP